jgi:hypothetical protein
VSYATILEQLAIRLETVAGVERVITYEPTTIQLPPMIYLLLDRVDRSQKGQVTLMTYRIMARLLIKWQENAAAEAELTSYLNAIPASIDADPHLASSVPKGLASVPEMQAGFVLIGSTKYRTLDFFVKVIEKGTYQGGI